MAFTSGWLTRLTNFISNVWEAFAEFLVQIWEKLQRWWTVILGIITTIFLMTRDAIVTLWNITLSALSTLEVLFGNVTSLDQTAAFSGAPWASTMNVIDVFIPLKEILAGALAISAVYGAILLVRAYQWLVKTVKWVIFNWT